MNRNVQFSFLFFAFLLIIPVMARAQEGKTNTVTITITEDGKVTTDTTFEIAEGQDPDALKTIVEELAGGDIHIKSAKKAEKKIMYIAEGDEGGTWEISDVDIDSIKEAHPGARVMVMKTDDGNINVKVLDEEDEDIEFKPEEGETYVVKVIKEGKGDCVEVTEDHHVVVSEDEEDGKHKVVIKEFKGEGDDIEKHIKVFIGEDDDVMIMDDNGDLKWIEEGGDGDHVIIIEKDNGEEKVVMKKQIKVKIDEDDKGDDNKEKNKGDKKKKSGKEK